MRSVGRSVAAPYLFLLPFYVAFAVFWLVPIGASLWYSFTSWSGMGASVFVGLDNYAQLFRDPTFWRALRNTFSYVLIYNVIMLPLATVIALVLNAAVPRLGRFFRTIYFVPVTVSLVVVALVFDLLFNREFGPVNHLLSAIGIDTNPRWLTSSQYAPWTIIIMRVWRATGYYSAFIFAGLQGIPKDIIEAARVDGASELRLTWHVVLPQLRPVLLFVFVMSSIWSFQLFDEPWILFQGGPGGATLTILQYLYQNTFLFGKVGYGAAMSYILTLIIVAFSLMQFRLLDRK